MINRISSKVISRSAIQVTTWSSFTRFNQFSNHTACSREMINREYFSNLSPTWISNSLDHRKLIGIQE